MILQKQYVLTCDRSLQRIDELNLLGGNPESDSGFIDAQSPLHALRGAGR